MPSPICIDVHLSNTLTASICSHLAVEFFKHIAYQRQQIPFPYKQLVSVLKRNAENEKKIEEQCSEDNSVKSGIRNMQIVQAENEYRKVNGIYHSMKTAFEDLEAELSLENGPVEEVALILGATPLSPRAVYRFQFPLLLYGHVDSNHPHQNSLLELFRCLISSEELHSFSCQPLSPTNMFLFLRKSNTNLATSAFAPKERYNIPASGKQAVIRLIPPANPPKCICGGANIYRDRNSENDESSAPCIEYKSTDEPEVLRWFQAHQTLKGFRDMKINGTSVSTFWLQSR